MQGDTLAQLHEGQTVFQMGSTTPEYTLEMAMAAAVNKTGAQFIEGVLHGSTGAIEQGICRMIFSGSKDALVQFLPLLSSIIGEVIYAGEVSQAAIFNLASLVNTYAAIQTFALSTAMVKCSQIDLATWFDFLKAGAGVHPAKLEDILCEFIWPVHFEPRDYMMMGPAQVINDIAKQETDMMLTLGKSLGLDPELLTALKNSHAKAFDKDATLD